MLGGLADDADATVAANDAAITAHLFDRSADFHSVVVNKMDHGLTSKTKSSDDGLG